jgi:muramoyltetrapeptide carboxypeptidase LdcA involved in peptidoglycan recycling
MTLRCPCGGALVAMGLLAVVSCSDSRRAEELELQRRQVEIMERAQALEEERLRAEQERQRAEQERQRREQLVSVYGSAAGRQVMEAIGGGRDLIVRYVERYPGLRQAPVR